MRSQSLVLLGLLLGATSPALADFRPVATRYGTLSSDEDRLLRLNGEAVPHIEGNNGLMLEKIYRIGRADVAVICDMGGTALPAQFYFVTISRRGAKVQGPYGTGNDDAVIRRKGDTIIMTMPGFLGPDEPHALRRAAFQETHVFRFRHGVVTDNGKPPR
jgi:hypothetical protein